MILLYNRKEQSYSTKLLKTVMDELKMGQIAIALLLDKLNRLGHLPGEVISGDQLVRINQINPDLKLDKEGAADFLKTLVSISIEQSSR